MLELSVNAARLAAELETLAGFSDTPSPAITRVVYSPSDQQARAWLKNLCVDAGLAVREDAVGNLFARWAGSDPHAAAVGTGSHIDAIPSSGRYDGTVGVLGALEAIRALRSAGLKPRKSIELLTFISEEPTRFGIGCLGSRMLCGSLTSDAATRLKDLPALRTEAGFSGDFAQVALPPGYYSHFLELHIEQGPILEQTGVPLGVVTSIAAPAGLRITIEGEGGHAGAVLMPQRRDAFSGAAEIALAIEAAALSTGAIDTVATTGVCQVFPGAVNSVPSQVKLEVDVRDTNLARRDAVLKQIAGACAAIAAKRELNVVQELVNADPPATCDPTVVEALASACRAEGQTFSPMVSRAYHDSLFMSRICPAAMLFIPCKGGVSHRPDEFASPTDIINGVRVLARALAALAA